MAVSAPFVGITVTLAAQNTAYNLLALVRAAQEATEHPCPSACTSFAIQVETASTVVSIGDGLLSTTRRGYKIRPGDFGGHGRAWQNIPFGHVYVLSDTDNTVLNIEVAA
jgi:hypothetical protein